MNRYKSGGPSKATATTKCQKCLKLGHYSFECTAAQQDRPYVSRPSRTQQLLNPKLAPKITEPEPKVEESKPKDIPPAEPSRKRGRDQPDSPRKRSRSMSTSDSDSVSTMSTNHSRSPSRSPRRQRKLSRNLSPDPDSRYRRRGNSRNRDQAHRRSHSPSPDRFQYRTEKKRAYSRSRSPGMERADRHARQSSRSPCRDGRGRRGDDYSAKPRDEDHSTSVTGGGGRKRSMSPFSTRLALTQSMGANA